VSHVFVCIEIRKNKKRKEKYATEQLEPQFAGQFLTLEHFATKKLSFRDLRR